MSSTITGTAAAVRPGAIAVKYGRFSVFVAGNVTIDGSFGPAGTDARMFLFDNAGNLLATSDDAGGTQALSTIVANLPVGTYFVAISSDAFDATEALSGVNVDDDAAPIPFSITVTDGSGQGFTTQLQGERTDNLTDTAGNDILFGLEGQDTIEVSNGIDQANGGLGPDQLILNYTGSTTSIVNVGGAPQVDVNGGFTGGFTDNAGRQVTFTGIEMLSINAGSGNDNIVGSGGVDVINGGSGDDTLDGGAGNDIVNGEAGNDILILSGTGTDSVDGGADVDTLSVNYGDATTTITSGALNGSGTYFGSIGDAAARQGSYNGIEIFDITTGSGNDSIRTGLGNDLVSLGGGDDSYFAGGGSDTADGGTGIDGIDINLGSASGNVVWNLQTNTNSGTGGSYTNFDYFLQLSTGTGNDTIVTTNDQRNDALFLNDGADSVTFRNGNDSVNGGPGIDTLIIDYSTATTNITTTGGEPSTQAGNGYLGSYGDGAGRSVSFQGIDLFNITTGSGNDTIILPNGLVVEGATPRITNDIVNLGGGDDSVNLGQGVDVADGGTGTDSLGANLSAATVAININLAANTYSGIAGSSFTNFEVLSGGAFGGFQTGSGNDIIVTANLNQRDQVTTNGGDDTVTFYDGNDLATFGAGVDTLVLDYSAATATVRNGQPPSDFGGTGTFFGDFTDGGTRTAAYQDAEKFDITTGSGNDNINTGSNDDRVVLGSGSDVASTGNGNDYLDGGTGADTLTGGAGNDIYIVDDAGDLTIEAANGGNDEVRTSTADYTVGANIERVTLTGSGGQTARGDTGNNNFTGSNGADLFILDQGGDDTVAGGGGDDGFYFGTQFTTADQVDGGAGTNDQLGLQGNYGSFTPGFTVPGPMPGGPPLVFPPVTNYFVFGANNLVNVETLALISGADARFGQAGASSYDYYLQTIDANVVAGATLSVGAGDLRAGEDLNFNGSAETDGAFRIFAGLGNDTLVGGAGNDGFFFGPGKFNGSDSVNGGAGTNDQLGLDGDYTITLGALLNIEVLALFKGPDSDLNSYVITTTDATVVAGQQFTVFGTPVVNAFTFDGAAETDGSFRIFGGRGGDTITGGSGDDLIYGLGGADTLTGNAGADTFIYTAASESTGIDFDTLVDFGLGQDVFQVGTTQHTFGENVLGGRLDSATFDADLAEALDGILGVGDSAIFRPDSGSFADRVFGVADVNGVDGYQAGEDIVVEFGQLLVGTLVDYTPDVLV